MKKNDHITMRWLLLLLLALLLNACSEDSEEARKQRIRFEAQLCSVSYSDESPVNARFTRAGDPTPVAWAPNTATTKYYAYEDLVGMFKEQKDLMENTIGVFLTQDAAFTEDGKNYIEGNFYYRSSTQNWNLDTEIEHGGTYFLYGYIPWEVATSASVEGNSSLSEGAILHINGLNSVTKTDVCVIVGAKEGVTEGENHSPVDMQTGQFAVNANAATKTGETSGSNYIYLLFDHLYTGLRFRFTLDQTYYNLRTIKLTRLEIRAYKDNKETKAKAKYDAIVTLKSNADNASPIESIEFSPVADSADSPNETLFEGEAPIEYNKYTNFMGSFVPGETTYFKLRSTYDVYDKKNTLVRKGCVAENTIDIRDMFKILSLERGHMYSLTIKVQPSYLYVLSEPDLDNPTITVTSGT